MEEIRKKIGQIFRLSMYLNFETNYNAELSVNKGLLIVLIYRKNIIKPVINGIVTNFKDNPSGKVLQLNRIIKELIKLKEEN